MSHPMEGYYDAERAASSRRWERIRKLRRRLAKTPLSEFTADYALALCIVTDPSVIEGSYSRHEAKIDEALDKIEAFYKKRRDRKHTKADPRYPTGKPPK